MNTIQPDEGSKHPRRPVMTASVLLGAIILSVEIFRWTLVEWLTPFVEPILELALGCAFLFVSLWSLVHFVRQTKKLGAKRAGTPLLLNTAVVLIALFVPFAKMTTAMNFRWNYKKRMEVVSEVLGGKLGNSITNSDGRGNLIHLPPSYRGLSAGGDDILVYQRDGQTLIFFFDFRGILDNFSGFVYSTGNAKPHSGDFGGQFFEIEELRPGWYWASSAN
jgi:hypothetical protein